MKRFLTVAAAMLALTGMGQVAMLKLEDLTNTNLVCVTNYGPQVVSLTARVTGLEGSSNDWSKTVSNLATLSNNVSALSSRVTATNALFSAWFAGLQSRTSYWDIAYSWGDWSTAGFATTQQVAAVADLAALRAYHYGSPDIVESPAGWFVFDGAGTITAFDWEAGRTNVVIPWAIGGVPVTAIGENAFQNLVTYQGHPVVSVVAPQTVTAIGYGAFYSCTSLASVSSPQAQTVGDGAFADCTSLTSVSLPQAQTFGYSVFQYCTSLTSVSLPQAQTFGYSVFQYCTSLTSVSLPQAQTVGDGAFDNCTSLASVYFDNDAPAIGAEIFANIAPNQVTNYVTNPTATGWGATLGGMPVVRLPLYADAIYQAGELVATFSQIAASNALPYTAWTGTITPANGTATVTVAHGNMPVLVTAAPCVLTLDPTGFGTSGVSRVSLSYYPGTNSFTFATNIIKYAETPTVDTNGWNTLLIRRVSDGVWKGVGL